MNGTDHDVIGSLGKVLSSVNLAGDEAAARRGFDNAIGSHPSSWTGLSTAPKANAPSSISYGLGQSTSLGNGGGNNPADSLQNVLYDSGIYEKDEVQVHRRASTGAVPTGSRPIYPSSAGASPAGSIDGSQGGGSRMRKPSIDIFLSQSPSKALGEDAFRLSGNMSRTNSNPSLVKMGSAVTGRGHAGKPPGMSSTAPSSRSESPLGMRQGGGLSSSAGQHVPAPPASTSPYGGGSIQQYNPPTNNSANSFSQNNQGGQLHVQLQHQHQHQQTQVMNQFAPNGMQGGMQGGMGVMQQQHHQQQPQMIQQQQHHQQQPQMMQQPQQQFVQVQQPQQIQQPAQQQSQIFYMAVTGPDGKQVLQPVQMVQMPGGQAGTIMMPMQQQQQPQQQVQQTNQQGMMLMQPQQQPQRQNGGGNPMYSGGLGGGGQHQQQQQQFQNQVGGGAAIGSSAYIDNLLGQQAQQTATQVIGPDGQVNVLYSSPQRPPLRALLGNVRRLSRDQVGCRLLQQALDEDGPSAATAILNEGLTFWAEAMVDPFGNYLFQKILERITPEERVTLVSSVSTRLVNASLNLHGTRSVQKIVEVCAIDEEDREDSDDDEEDSSESKSEAKSEDSDSKSAGKKKKKKKDSAAKILTDALRPSAARLCIDSHGNHAIQRILLKLPYQRTQFIFDAVAASVEDVARHRHGCCVIQRCLDSRHSAARSHLVDRIVEKSLELMQDAYGNYVVQYVLDVCGDDEVHAICESVVGKVCVLAVQKFSSNVMEKCLERCTDRVREEYLNELNDSDRLRELMMDPFGNYVVQRALSVSTHAQAIRLVETMKPHLSTSSGGGIRNTAGGRRILGKICRRFPNFQLEGETFEDYDLNQVLARSGHHAPTSSNPHHGRGGPRGGGWDGPRGGGGGYDSGRGGYDSGRGGYGGYNSGPSPNLHHGGHRGGGRGRYRPGYGNHNPGMNGGGNGGYGPPGMAYGAGPPGLQGLQVQTDGMGMMGAHQQPGMYQGGGVGGSYMYNHQGM